MKNLIIAACLFAGALFVNAETKYSSKLDRVKIYVNGAEVHRSASINLKAGTQTIVFKDLSIYMDPNSIIIGASNNVSILSSNYGRNNDRNRNENPKIQKLNDSLQYYYKKRSVQDNRYKVLNAELKLLQQNSKLGGTDGVNIDDLERATAFFNKRYTYLYDEMAKVQEKKNEISAHQRRIRRKIQKLRQDYPVPPQGQITVQVNAERAGVTQFNFSYLTRNANWYSTYEARCNDIGKPVTLIHKASINQRTGENWNNVKLELSTGNPNVGVNVPKLYPRYLSFNQYKPAYSNRVKANNYITPQYLDMDKDEVAESSSGRNNSFQGSRTLNKYTSQTSNEVAVEYVVDRPYNLPSNGKVQLVTLKSYEVEAKYNYYTVPKLGSSVYLIAKLSGWQQYNLLRGQVSLFFKGSYVGKTYFNPRANSDTLQLSLGKDPKVIVQRKTIRDYTKVKTIGANKKETIGYSISINNTNNKAIQIEVVDQIPISKHSNITVEVTEQSKGTLNEKTGEMNWTLTLKPGKTKTLEVYYDVTSPKNKTVYGL